MYIDEGGESMYIKLSNEDINMASAKVVSLAILIFVETVCLGLITLLETTPEPTTKQYGLIFLTAIVALTTYLAAFIRTGKVPEEANS